VSAHNLGLPATAAGYKAIDSLRLEKGYRYWSSEISPDYSPLEAGLGFSVKLNKKDFIGKEALLKQKGACLTLSDSRTIALGKEPIRSKDGKMIGWVAAGGYGYSVGQSIIYAYLPMEFIKVGTELEVEFLGEQVGAVVVQAPFMGSQR
jgi:4-methylaminobutanoate oxidase (formaldehyde-forming)